MLSGVRLSWASWSYKGCHIRRTVYPLGNQFVNRFVANLKSSLKCYQVNNKNTKCVIHCFVDIIGRMYLLSLTYDS